jgi:hypothetical protein
MLRLIDENKVVMGCPPAALTGAAGDGDYVSMKYFSKLSIIIAVDNGSTVTGGAVTLKQATAVAGTGETALGFGTVWANIDTGAGDAMTETAVTSDTFTTDTTNNKNLLYVIEVDESDLAAGFTSVRVDVASMANAVGSVTYVLHGARHDPLTTSAIVD